MNKRLNLIFYIVPALIFLALISTFYRGGELNLYEDAKTNCIYTNYFLNNIIRGVYPFWNPFTSWGRPDDLLARMMGEFNPFLYATVLLQKIGFGFAGAYFGYLILYFITGLAGIYFISKHLFKDTLIVWMVCLCAMFSNLCGNLFNNIFVILIFVPSIWFFFFLLRFTEGPRRCYLLGMVFCAMIILTTYMPFHFLVMLACLLLFYAVFYWDRSLSIAREFASFIRQNKIFTIFCLISLVLSALPGLFWYRSNLNGNIIYAWRGLSHSLYLDRSAIDSGNFIATHALISPYSNLKDAELSNPYIPLIFVLITLVGMVLPLTRRRMLLFAMGLFIFLVTATNASPLMGFFYKHIFFFKYFRNIHFFVWAFDIVLIFLVMDIFQGLMGLKPKTKLERFGLCVLTAGVHLAMLIVLKNTWNVDSSSYAVLFLSFVFFILYYSGILKYARTPFLLLVFVMLLLQPVQVLWTIDHKMNTSFQFPFSKKPYSIKDSVPQFQYLRPTPGEERRMPDTGHVGDINDRSGFIPNIWQYQGTKWSLDILQSYPASQDLQYYVRHKFVLYQPFQKVELGPGDGIPPGQWLDGPFNEFKVVSFDLNYMRLLTSFPEDHILVYNDSYDPAWQATINGKQVPVIRANEAFKGIFLPAGHDDVLFSYHSPFYRGSYLLLILYFQLVFIYLIILLVRRDPHEAVL